MPGNGGNGDGYTPDAGHSRCTARETCDEIHDARQLDIGYLLRGNLRRKGHQIRISNQLLDTANGGIRWAQRYGAPLDTLFDIQDESVARVLGALSSQIDKVLVGRCGVERGKRLGNCQEMFIRKLAVTATHPRQMKVGVIEMICRRFRMVNTGIRLAAPAKKAEAKNLKSIRYYRRANKAGIGWHGQ